MLEPPLLTLGLAFLIPIGYALISASGLDAQRARQGAISFLAALGLSIAGYVITGFALQFGGVGLVHEIPCYNGLIWEWSALGVTWGPGWGMAGLSGWAMTGGAATPEARLLALANLPWVLTAALIPVSALRGRIPGWATALLGFLVGALIYPLAGNWIWGGGWLANLGSNLFAAHGFVDPGGAGLVNLLGAAVAVAGLLVFLPRRSGRTTSRNVVPLPEGAYPLLGLLGVGLLFAGLAAYLTANPLLPKGIETQRVLLNTLLAAGGAALLSVGYTWLVAGRPDQLMGSRAVGATVIAGLAAAAFIPAWSALVLGMLIGLLTPITVFLVERILRWDDITASLTVHGLGSILGLVTVGLLADGTAGAGWNGIGGGEYLEVTGQGVTGLLAANGFRADFPLQLQSQLVGCAALALLGFFAAWLSIAPLATAMQLLSERTVTRPSSLSPAAANPGDEEPEPDTATLRDAAKQEIQETGMPPGELLVSVEEQLF